MELCLLCFYVHTQNFDTFSTLICSLMLKYTHDAFRVLLWQNRTYVALLDTLCWFLICLRHHHNSSFFFQQLAVSNGASTECPKRPNIYLPPKNHLGWEKKTFIMYRMCDFAYFSPRWRVSLLFSVPGDSDPWGYMGWREHRGSGCHCYCHRNHSSLTRILTWASQLKNVV